jgi:hypothetical protein
MDVRTLAVASHFFTSYLWWYWHTECWNICEFLVMQQKIDVEERALQTILPSKLVLEFK